MALTKRQFVQYLKDADFRTLFIEEMGWNKYSASIADVPTMYVEDKAFNLKTIAHRNGFQVLVCNVPELPSNSVCKKLDTKLRKAANDYICIFVIPGTEHQQWVAPVKTNEKRDIVIIEYTEAEKAQFLYEKISGLSFSIDEVTTIVDVKERIQSAFAINSEKITKDFYTGFNKEHKAFADFITGIDDQVATKDNKNKQWYTSVMLNRLMFCYFIQKKGFLDGDENYLSNKLHWVQEKKGKNQFFNSFYKGFLVQLFRGGLNSPKHDDAFEDMYGRIPYLNGGMFDVHQIERDYADIDIKDEAFESLFAFFDKWRWHLDTRVTASGRDINPDVLGYIFEQYINDRAQMGAYYTKEDITEYIGRNTIIPYLFNATEKKYPQAFEQNAQFWEFLHAKGEDFIYDAVKKGVHETLPEDIALGIDTEAPDLLERRKLWNNPTPTNYGLPTEIWRETIERRQRYNEIVGKLHSGEIKSFNDFITYNLNTPKIAYDFLNFTNDKKFIEVFYGELLKITILDPTCGSGAFLFAALNLLEPLYEVCISRMEEFNAQDHESFKDQLAEINNKYRSNIQYFIYKSIILRNLYGVDIMAEAVEIAKLRLFLKMVAVVEVDKRTDNMGLDPLPDVDFNIRCGNSLVGYATESQLYHDLDVATDFLQQIANQELKDKLKSKLQDVADTYEVFRLEQLSLESDVQMLKDAKRSLNNELAKLNELLNKHLYASTAQIDYDVWLNTHQPFHWLAEFYQIMHDKGGFDIIIGNPPYVVYTRKDKKTHKAVCDYYRLSNYETLSCNNLYAFVIERCVAISNTNSTTGMIIPISGFSNGNMIPLQTLLKKQGGSLYVSTYHQRPAQLFVGVLQRLCIFICSKGSKSVSKVYTTGINRWYANTRAQLFSNLSFVEDTQEHSGSFVKIGSRIEKEIKKKFYVQDAIRRYLSQKDNQNSLYYRSAGGGYWISILNKPFDSVTSSNRCASFNEKYQAKVFSSFLNSNLFWWYYSTNYDLFNFTEGWMFDANMNYPSSIIETKLIALSEAMEDSLRKNAFHYVINSATNGEQNTVTYRKYLSKDIMDSIDAALAEHYGFTEEELDYIINYDIKYRMGDELIESE